MTTARRKKRMLAVAKQRYADVAVVFEDIHDPHNVLAALRNCDAFGVQEVHFIFEEEKAFNPRRMGRSSAAGVNKWLDFHLWFSTRQALDTLQDKGYQIWATVVDKKSQKLWQVDFCQPKIALVFGNEHRGVSPLGRHLADQTIYIPMFGFVDSLNLSVSVGVTLYELRRQRERHCPSLVPPHPQALLKRWEAAAS